MKMSILLCIQVISSVTTRFYLDLSLLNAIKHRLPLRHTANASRKSRCWTWWVRSQLPTRFSLIGRLSAELNSVASRSNTRSSLMWTRTLSSIRRMFKIQPNSQLNTTPTTVKSLICHLSSTTQISTLRKLISWKCQWRFLKTFRIQSKPPCNQLKKSKPNFKFKPSANLSSSS